MKKFVMLLTGTCLGAGLALGGDTLPVGPGKKFDKPSAAIAAAKDGDIVEIDAAGSYDGDVAYIKKNSLTIRGKGEGRAKLDSKGKVAGGKAIFVAGGNDITIENIEFIGARCDDGNGAGIRAEGKNLTVRNCRIHDCQDAILGGAGVVTIEYCEFSHCGLSESPVTHNLYISPSVDKLIYRHNYSHFTTIGHLLKSRAKENIIMYNRISDEDGTGSYVINLPNGGRGVIVGNVIQKGPKALNNNLIAYGEEGIKHTVNELLVANNTFVNDLGKGEFITVKKVPEDFTLVVRNNIFAGKGSLCNFPKAVMEGNFSGGDPMFVDAAKYDYHLKAGSPCINKGVEPGKAGELSLAPESQYVHPSKAEKRPADGKLDIGAFEFSADKSK